LDYYYKFHDGNPLFGLRRQGSAILTLQHLTYREITKQKILTKETLQSFFKFTIIRDPFKRLVSDFYWQKEHDLHNEFGRMDFQDFLDFAERVIGENLYFKKLHYDHFRPIKEYCYSDNKLIMDDIMVLDRIEKDAERLYSRIRLENIFKVNSSSRDIDAISTKENIDRAYALYSDDKEIYDQVFDYKKLPQEWLTTRQNKKNPQTEI